MQETRVVLRNMGKIDPVKVEDYVAQGGYEGLKKAIALSADEIINLVKESGLRGRGGAGFSTGSKWQFVKNTPADQKYVVCNADEGEPGTSKDLTLMKNDPNTLFEGMAIAGVTVGATYGYIYLRAEYPYLFPVLEQALANARAKGYLGKNIMGSKFDFDIEVRSGAGAYVCGEETALIESIEGKRGEPRFKPPYPGVEGLWGKPTLVNNVETLSNLPEILVKGAAWFKTMGTATCAGTKIFSLCGNVANPCVVEYPFGVNLKQLVEEVGGGAANGRKVKAVQTGGASGCILRADQIDFAMDIENCLKNGASLGSGAICVIDDSKSIVETVHNLLSFFVHESCGKCTPCREGNMRLYELCGRFLDGTAKEEDLDTMLDLADTMMLASLCGLGQTSPTAVVTSIANFRNEYLDCIANAERRNS